MPTLPQLAHLHVAHHTFSRTHNHLPSVQLHSFSSNLTLTALSSAAPSSDHATLHIMPSSVVAVPCSLQEAVAHRVKAMTGAWQHSMREEVVEVQVDQVWCTPMTHIFGSRILRQKQMCTCW
jgi:hypothetical protein